MKKLLAGLLNRLQMTRGDVNRSDRIGAFTRAWEHVFGNHIVGDNYEFGVYEGESLVASYQS